MKPFVDITEFINWVESQKRFSKKEDLSKMKYFCEILNHPETKFKSIHVTGTNGKGSTVSMIKSILMDKGLNIGTFTSPYITCFNERIGFNRAFISDEELIKYANRIISLYPKMDEDNMEYPTFFEFVTLIAFLYFSEKEELDVAIIEVGIGGRIDSTNVINPILTIITNIALDHMQVLGDTKEAILGEKLGIMKPNTPMIVGIKDENLIDIATNKAQKFNSTLIIPKYESLEIIQSDLNGSIFNYCDLKNITINMVGHHQIENSLLAIEAFKILKDILNLDSLNLYNGLKSINWPGRFERISDNPLLYVDGSHNIDGVKRICEFVKTLDFKWKRAVVSISADKELEEMVNLLDDTFDEIIFSKYTYARSADSISLFDLSQNPNKKSIDTLDKAIEYIKNNPNEFTIFMGSLYLVSEVRKKYI